MVAGTTRAARRICVRHSTLGYRHFPSQSVGEPLPLGFPRRFQRRGVVENRGIEPLTSALQRQRSTI